MDTCLTCVNDKSCATCDSSINRALNSTTNLCDCAKGYY